MRKSEELQNILDECLERLLIKGESLEQCLRSYPEYAEELKPLLDTLISAREVSSVEPRPEFMARARYQFRVALQESKAGKAHRFFGWQPLWTATIATVMTFILASGVTVGASGNSMPDEALYPVKVAVEQIQLTVTRSPVSKAELYAKLADRRVEEIVYLAGKNKPEMIEATARRLDNNLGKITDLTEAENLAGDESGEVLEAPRAAFKPAPTEQAPLMVAPKSPQIVVAPAVEKPEPTLEQKAPPPVVSNEQPSEKDGTSVKRVRREADRDKLRALIARYAEYHPEKLRAALEKAPPSVRAALLEAIRISEDRYKEANQALERGRTGIKQPTSQKITPEQTQNEMQPQQRQRGQSRTRLESARQLQVDADALNRRIQSLKEDKTRLKGCTDMVCAEPS